jgi:hypothetical protein
VAHDTTTSQLPPLSRVKISLQTVQDVKIGAGANFLVISLKGYDENAITRSLDIVLVPEHLGGAMTPRTPTLATELEAAIRTARDQVAMSYPSSSNAPLLKTDEVDIQIGFAVTRGASAGASWVLTPISPSVSGEISHKTTHTVTLVFANSSKP